MELPLPVRTPLSVFAKVYDFAEVRVQPDM